MTPFSQTAKTLILVTGPARSGKSEWAEALATQTQKRVIYIATAEIDSNDREWQARIEKHRRRRSPTWETQEVARDLPLSIRDATASCCLLVDSLGTWVANYLNHEENAWENVVEALLESLQQTTADVILVAEETGWGVVPAYPLGRTFRDRLGTVVRRIAAIADPVYLVTGGYALNLKTLGIPLPPQS